MGEERKKRGGERDKETGRETDMDKERETDIKEILQAFTSRWNSKSKRTKSLTSLFHVNPSSALFPSSFTFHVVLSAALEFLCPEMNSGEVKRSKHRLDEFCLFGMALREEGGHFYWH